MQDRSSCNLLVRILAGWSAALASLMMIIVGGLLPSGLISPSLNFPPEVLNLPSSWQVPAILTCSLVCGPRISVIASVAYLTIGIFYLPIFHNGGSTSYLLTPSFGYLIGFIPACWASGHLSKQKGMNSLINLYVCALTGLMVIHACGVINLLIGSYFMRWPYELHELILSYSLIPLPAQLILSSAVALISLTLRHLLLVK